MKKPIQITLLLFSFFLCNELRAQNPNVISPYLDLQGPLYSRENINTLSKANNGWIPWAIRNTSQAETKIDLANILSINASGGSVGIGTSAPLARLDINGKGDHIINFTSKIIDADLQDMISLHSLNKTSTLNLVSSREDAGLLGGLLFTTTKGWLDSHANIAGIVGGRVGTDPTAGGYLGFWTKNGAGDIPKENMRISQEGFVGIGTTTPDAKLTVKGNIHTREVLVDMAGAVAGDYVFEKDYNLIPLTELATYLKQNKHLPEVPSAKEFEAEGMKLKEMNLTLLKKVEELTLYVIEQNNRLNSQMEIINSQAGELEMLKIEVSSLKK